MALAGPWFRTMTATLTNDPIGGATGAEPRNEMLRSANVLGSIVAVTVGVGVGVPVAIGVLVGVAL